MPKNWIDSPQAEPVPEIPCSSEVVVFAQQICIPFVVLWAESYLPSRMDFILPFVAAVRRMELPKPSLHYARKVLRRAVLFGDKAAARLPRPGRFLIFESCRHDLNSCLLVNAEDQ